MNLRPYQLDALAKIESGFDMFARQLAVLPTGSGKTILFSHITQRRMRAGQRTLILAHREELIDQAIDKLRAATGIIADKEKAEYRASLNAHVVVGSVQSLMRQPRLERWPKDHFGLVVVDEAHHVLAKSYRGLLAHFDGHADVLGVTATPDRADRKNLGEYFENVPFEISLLDLINDGYLSRITIKSIPLKIDLNAVKQTGGDFDETDLANTIEPYLGEIAKALVEHASFRRTLAFLPLRATSRKFVEHCQAAGLSACHIDGESSDRKEILARYAAGEFDVLSNASLLLEGFDDPGIDCIVMLRPTRSRPLYVQAIGRGTRIHPAKDSLLLLDPLWLHEKHSISRPAHLIASTPEEADIITEISQTAGGASMELDLQVMSTEAQQKREEALRKRLEEAAKKKPKFVSAEDFAIQHDSLAVAEYEPTMPWESEPVTDKQLWHLKRAHIDAATVRGKGHATKLLGIMFGNQKLMLATPRQRGVMRRMGHPNAEMATADDARRFFAGLNRKAG